MINVKEIYIEVKRPAKFSYALRMFYSDTGKNTDWCIHVYTCTFHENVSIPFLN